MKQYKVVTLEDEYSLEKLLNEMAEKGWQLHSMETEYRTSIIILEMDKKEEETKNV